VFKLPNGLKPSVAKASLKFLGSSANVGYLKLKSFHAFPSAGWLISFSTGVLLISCHWVSSAVLFVAIILISLGIRGKCLKTL
jgi:hypothetical protein